MRLPDPRPRRAEAPNGLAAAARASGRFPALPENADRELPRPPREVAFLIREPERRSGALTVRISSTSSTPQWPHHSPQQREAAGQEVAGGASFQVIAAGILNAPPPWAGAAPEGTWPTTSSACAASAPRASRPPSSLPASFPPPSLPPPSFLSFF